MIASVITVSGKLKQDFTISDHTRQDLHDELIDYLSWLRLSNQSPGWKFFDFSSKKDYIIGDPDDYEFDDIQSILSWKT